MTVRQEEGAIVLEGDCRVEEAETLTRLLQETALPVDLSACRSLHAAVAQALMVFRREIVGESADPFMRDFLKPALLRRDVRATAGIFEVRGGDDDDPDS